MIYCPNTSTFRSASNEFKIESVTEEMMYSWVKSGQLSYTDFKIWIKFIKDESHEDGVECGLIICDMR